MPTDPTKIIVRRSLNLSKTYVLLSIVIAANGIIVASFGNTLVKVPGIQENSNVDIHTSLPFLSVPLMTTGALTLTVPVVLLFVYDKNNGVLERFLSLGLNQADIYKRYLKASIWLTLTFLPIAIIAFVTAGWVVGTNIMLLLEASALLVVLALSVVTLVNMSMMSFSSLQRERVGASQPVGIGIGGLAVLPYYAIPLVWPLQIALPMELAIGLAIGAVSLVLLILSSRLISREKLLP